MDFMDACRVCLKNSRQHIDLETPFEQDVTGNGKKHEYGETQTEPFTYLDCLRMCTRLEITEDNYGINGVNVPKSLCDTCGIELRITYDFLQKAKQAHEILQKAMLETKVEINENKWIIDYENAHQFLEADCKVEADLEELQENAISENTDEDENAQQFLAADCKVEQSWTSDEADIEELQANAISENTDEDENTQERLLKTEIESDIVTVGLPSTSTLDPLIILKEPNKKGCNANKRTSKDKSIKTTLTEPKQRGNPNEQISNQKSKQKRIFLCHACPLIYRDAHKFRQHTLAHEGKRERKLTCEQCGKAFFNQTALQHHVKIHEVNRQPTFHCDKCDKSFFHGGSLRLHKQYHSEKRIDCKVCGKLYVRQTDLNVHSRSHSGDLPYKCQKCDMAFAQMGHLNKHLENHDGYRYKCDLCGKEYLTLSSLSRHYIQHTGKPFKCSICDKGFTTNYQIRRHIGGVHKLDNAEEVDKLIIKVKTKKEYLWQKKTNFLTINKNN